MQFLNSTEMLIINQFILLLCYLGRGFKVFLIDCKLICDVN